MARVLRLGKASWAAVGVIVLLVILAVGVGAISGIVAPLVVAFIIGVVMEPLVSRLERWGLSRALASVAALVVAVALAAGVIVVIVRGFVSELPKIYDQLGEGWNSFVAWGRTLDLDPLMLERVRASLDEYAPQVTQGLVGVASGTFSGALALAVGTFFALFFLFFVLRDGPALALGNKPLLIPGHIDPTINLHDVIVVSRNDVVIDLWPIEARGALF